MNLLTTKQSLIKGKTFYIDVKISRNGTLIRVFSSFFVNFSKIMFLPKAFSMSERYIHQILRLNYYQKL